MDFETYNAKRESLLADVKAAQADNDPKRMNELMDQVEALEQEFQALAVEAANKRAEAEAPAPVKLENMSRAVPGGKVVEKMEKTENFAAMPLEELYASKTYHDAFFKTLQGKPLNDVEMRATAVSAPKVIPTETANHIYGRLADAPLLGAITMMHVPGALELPVAGTVNDATWVAMANAATDSADTVTSVALAAYKLIKTLEITADLAAMAIPEFEAWLVDSLAKKLRSALDNAVINGTGSGQPTGMLHGSELDEVQYTALGPTYADVLKLIGTVPTAYRKDSMFVLPSAFFYEKILGMVDTNKRPIIVADPQAPEQYRLLGYPVILDDSMTAATGIFGNLAGYVLNIASDIKVESDTSVAFRSGSTVFRGMCLADGKTVEKAGLRKWTAAG